MGVLRAAGRTTSAVGIVGASLLAIAGGLTTTAYAAESGAGTPPVNTGLPAIAGATYGGAPPGQTLSCSPGSWTGTPSPSFGYQWLRNGAIITGATEPAYITPVTEEPTSLVCEVTASNEAGKQAARSTGVSILFTECCDGPTMSATPAQLTARLEDELTPVGKAPTINSLLKRGGFAFSFDEVEVGTAVIDWYQVPHGAALAIKAKPSLVAAGKLADSGRWVGQLWTAPMAIKLTTEGKRVLKHAHQLRLMARGTFRASFGSSVGATKVFVLKR